MSHPVPNPLTTHDRGSPDSTPTLGRTPSYLDGGIAAFQEGDGQENTLMEDPVAGCIHDEVDHQIGGPLLVEVTLDLGQAHVTPAHGAGSGASSWKHTSHGMRQSEQIAPLL